MKKTALLLFAFCLSGWLMSLDVSAQSYNRVSEKNIKVVKGKKLVLTGAVRDGDEVVYRFRGRAGHVYGGDKAASTARFELCPYCSFSCVHELSS